MSSRFLASLVALGGAFALVPLAQARVAGQAPQPSRASTTTTTAKTVTSTRSPAVARTPDGRPDLQGNWSFATVTPLERPRELGDKEVLTDEEAAAYEKQAAERNDADRRNPGTAADVALAYNNFWYDRGTKIVGTKRTSLLTDPKDGRLPALTADAQKAAAARGEVRRRLPEGPEDRSLGERCLLFNAGPPMVPGPYNNNFQLVQTPDAVVIANEMIHDVRVVPLDGRPHLAKNVRNWLGDSRGRWQDDTLVVETTNFTGKTAFRGSDENLRLVERFTRVDAGTLLYEFTVDDPTAFTKPWTVSIPLTHLDEQIYEYACHEANYAMPGMLKAARMEEKEKSKAR
jgi:hypothetical protein